MTALIKESINQWLDDVVIGLNLCPFAAKPQRLNQIHIDVFTGHDESELDKALLTALDELQSMDAEQRETTLLVIPNALTTFDEYMLYLQQAQWLLQRAGLEGVLQIASFHPNYQFDGTEPSDKENLTNRAPYPILHLIREDSLTDVLSKYPDPESIPEDNIARVEGLSPSEIKNLFPHIK
jgi:hypothetical protein